MLAGYSLQLVDQLIVVVAASTIVAYALYTVTAREGNGADRDDPVRRLRHLPVPAPRSTATRRGEEPDQVLVTDLPILAAVAAWATTCGLLLSF